MRRYHHSPSIPFLIANAEGVCEPVGSSLSGVDASRATDGAPDHQAASDGLKKAPCLFLWSLWIAGLAIGGGLALELNGMMHQGLFAQAFGFFIAGVAVIRHPGE